MEQIPAFFNIVFSTELIAMVGVIVSTTKIFRNALGSIKGTPALIITFAISLAVGEFTYFQQFGILFAGFAGLLGGAASSGIFAGTKWIGKNVVKKNIG